MSNLSGTLVAGQGLAWLPSPTRLGRNNLLDTIRTAPNFRLSFKIRPTGIVGTRSSILHFTTGRRFSGGRHIPGIWFLPWSTRLFVRIGRGLVCNTNEELPIYQVTHVKLRLHRTVLKVKFGRRKVCHVYFPRKEPGHTSVKVYAGHPWHNVAQALVWRVRYVPLGLAWLPSPTWLNRNYLLDMISTAVNFELTFNIWPTGTVRGRSSILHFTRGGNFCVGCGIPALGFFSSSTMLYAHMGHVGCNANEELPINQMTRVTMRLHGASLQVVFDGREVCQAHYPEEESGHMRVKVYAGDPWYRAAHALVSDMRYMPLVTVVTATSSTNTITSTATSTTKPTTATTATRTTTVTAASSTTTITSATATTTTRTTTATATSSTTTITSATATTTTRT